ncbi:hypothetical protein CYMTET_18614 [Cymbomonas tetramitiformis]|uniref:Uncharacterized protein n=1 Tax=Cymbomonas tetramitiformis TaxID=36881 RepID=A0AAE0G928_9CHLO|nr:hypothetical protein CYMTET_18614 [Cymbomonas tetramitiformis]
MSEDLSNTHKRARAISPRVVPGAMQVPGRGKGGKGVAIDPPRSTPPGTGVAGGGSGSSRSGSGGCGGPPGGAGDRGGAGGHGVRLAGQVMLEKLDQPQIVEAKEDLLFPWFEEEKEEIKPLLWEIPHSCSVQDPEPPTINESPVRRDPPCPLCTLS